MSMLDLVSDLDAKAVIAPVPVTATGGGADTTGTLVVSNEVNSYTLALFANDTTGDGVVTYAIEESDDNSVFTAVTGDRLNTGGKTVPAQLVDGEVYLLGITDLGQLTKPYVRVTITVTGTSGTVNIGAFVLLGKTQFSPAGATDAHKVFID